MNKELLLTILNKALKDYKAYSDGVVDLTLNTEDQMHKGFCYYFQYGIHDRTFPERYLKQFLPSDHEEIRVNIGMYWFGIGSHGVSQRIALLDQAIAHFSECYLENVNLTDCVPITAHEYFELVNPEFVGQTKLDENDQYYMVWCCNNIFYRTINTL